MSDGSRIRRRKPRGLSVFKCECLGAFVPPFFLVRLWRKPQAEVACLCKVTDWMCIVIGPCSGRFINAKLAVADNMDHAHVGV